MSSADVKESRLFFVWSPDGTTFCTTEEEARSEADMAIAMIRSECDEEWPEPGVDVFWGEIRERSKEVAEGESVNYKMRPLQ